MKTDSGLILVSNAEPYAHNWNEDDEIEQEKLAGGLTSAMDPLLQEAGGTWVAWGREEADFEVLDSENKVRVPDENGYDLRRLNLSEEEVEEFYLGFSNEVLWPLSHSFLERSTLEDYRECERKWNFYEEVNRKYADAVLEEYSGDEGIWIHDYHLTLVPRMVREEYPDADIAFFWHIPWPSWSIFGALPWRKEVLKGMLSSNFLGFHTPSYKKEFVSCAEKAGLRGKESNLEEPGVGTTISSVPLGIDYDWFTSLAEKDEFKREAQDLRDDLAAERIILGVDRLDYTKGIPQRLRAFELFLEENPEFQGEVSLIQRIPPSRTSADEYQSTLEKIERIVGEINGKFGKHGWTPVKSFHRFLPKQEQLIPYYLAADVQLVTSLCDGMNLVSKEYVATTDEGVLILSEFAGAAEELEEAIQINPYNVKETAQSIKRALTMPSEEKRERLNKLKKKVRENDLMNWRDRFMEGWLDK
ncbi:alpha,alpha-trehalose-phosphate synthase [candidate division MSBL1 archaeon SCGC-AAA259I09]|uniref:Alpha,alpha-trehalose-phosphate synthase n=1 Tax=candidate division MSBL1 archaeon SCGC-AAA259I09 TaxID=1698267 RepID=A0A133URE5_9EURY|nr:alpha,alpha-trehalose-phosphate synthase [candidate division MSBL1 archaeon SCGC-AAA259I09]